MNIKQVEILLYSIHKLNLSQKRKMLTLLVMVLAAFLPVTSAFQSSGDILPFEDDSENDFNGVTVVEDNPRCE